MTTNYPLEALWLTLNPSLKRLDQRLISRLARQVTIARWEYCQNSDEPCCLENAIALLHSFLAQQPPLHLLGHGMGGILGLIYARRYPERVRSLTLLSVGGQPGTTWHSHYYAMRKLLPCSRTMLLEHFAKILLGQLCPAATKALAKLLALELDHGFTPHSLARMTNLTPDPVLIPLLVCRGNEDTMIDPHHHQQWRQWLQLDHSSSGAVRQQLWTCPEGGHFFHFEAPERVASQIYHYWQTLAALSEPVPLVR